MKMTSQIKKLAGAALALCLLLSCPPAAYAMGDETRYPEIPASGPCGPNAVYEVVDGVLTISGTGPLTSLPGFDADFSGLLHTVVIDDGITALTEDTFLNFLPAVSAVELPDSLQYVGRLPFAGTAWLEGQTEEFVIVGDGILLDYNGPGGRVIVPNTVRMIASDAFFGTDVTELVIGSSVKYIGDGTWRLEWTEKLETLVINGEPLALRYISDDVWAGFDPWIKVEAARDDLGTYYHRFLVMDGILLAYQGPRNLKVTVPDAVRAIAPGGLSGSFSELVIPETVTELGDNAILPVGDESPVIVRGAPDSAVQRYVEAAEEGLFSFVPVEENRGSLLNFAVKEEFVPSRFDDVSGDEWFYPSVRTAYELGLMEGRSGTAFDPYGQLRLNEAVTVAARMRDIYYGEHTDFSADSVWYWPYADYALTHGIIAEAPDSWECPVTRAELAAMLAAVLPERELEAVNNEVSFADLDESHPACCAIMALARAGVLRGRDEGRFDPDASAVRSEAAAMLSRCVLPELRMQLD